MLFSDLSALPTTLLLASFAFETQAFLPRAEVPLRARNGSSIVTPASTSAAEPPVRPGINANITGPNGLDITSSFHTKVYIQPKIVAQPGLTGRQTYPFARPINTCKSSNAIFRYSHCRPQSGIPHTLQQYIVFCLENPPTGYPGRLSRAGRIGPFDRPGRTPRYGAGWLPEQAGPEATDSETEMEPQTPEQWPSNRDQTMMSSDAGHTRASVTQESQETMAPTIQSMVSNQPTQSEQQSAASPSASARPLLSGIIGQCSEDEVCVNGLNLGRGMSAMASCVKKIAFEDVLNKGDVSLGGRMVSIVLSGEDGSTPTDAGRLGVAVESGQVRYSDARLDLDSYPYPTQEGPMVSTCEHCLGLSTRMFAPSTDGLRVEASIAAAAGTVATGVLWMAVLTG